MGRRGFHTYSTDWAPPDYVVDETGKVVGGYRPEGVSNWGRWGPDDQRGTANLIGEEEVRRAASLVRRGRVFSLALPIDHTAPRLPERPPVKHYVVMSGSDAVCGTPYNARVADFTCNDDAIDINTQVSTQWDGLAHVVVHDTLYNGNWAGRVTAAGGAEVLGIGNMRASFVGRGVLLDLARHAGVDSLEPGTVVEAEHLTAVAEAQQVEVGRGDMLLLRTGYLQRWWGLETDEERTRYFTAGEPGPGRSAVGWFAEREIAAAASDTVGFEVIPSESDNLWVHQRMLVDLGLTIGEFWDLDELAADCAADGVYEFLLVAQPLYLPRAVASPLNPIAIK